MKKIISFVLILSFCFALFACNKDNTIAEESPYAKITVNGELVTDEEIAYFVPKYRAQVVKIYTENYGATYDEDFWNKDYNGKSPKEYLYELAENDAVFYKCGFQVMKENGVYSDISFAGFKSQAEKYNAQNQNANGVVGLKSIDMSNFYTYYFNSGKAKLSSILGVDDIDNYLFEISQSADVVIN